MPLPDPKDRILMFTSGVDLATIGILSKSIIEINHSDATNTKLYALNDTVYTPPPIQIYIDSYGGHVYQCLGLMGIMENSKTPIHTIVTGCAMSCGFMIAITGHKRLAYKTSTFMYHQISAMKLGRLKEIEEDIIEAKRLQKVIDQHTLRRTKITQAKLKENYETKTDWFMNSPQALANGVIDEII
jgi:ATP-dependent Clp protease protease subunit